MVNPKIVVPGLKDVTLGLQDTKTLKKLKISNHYFVISYQVFTKSTMKNLKMVSRLINLSSGFENEKHPKKHQIVVSRL